jgi:hypothetical protein
MQQDDLPLVDAVDDPELRVAMASSELAEPRERHDGTRVGEGQHRALIPKQSQVGQDLSQFFLVANLVQEVPDWLASA